MNPYERCSLQGKVAVITGASKGIGKSIAYMLGAAGAKVVVSSRKQEAVEAVAEEFRQDGIEVMPTIAHAGKLEDIEALVAKTLEKYERIDIVVNNAAVNPVYGPVIEIDNKAFDKIMQVNVKAVFELCKRAYPVMKENGGGAIINISSVGGVSPEEGLGIYSVSKAALISLTKVIAREWGKDGIRANVICPGLIKTKFSAPLWKNEETLNRFIKSLPLSRIGESEEVATLALFLASEAASYCTGGVYMADGGLTI